MVSETVQVSGHILDSLILPKILDEIMDLDGTFEILEIAVGKRKTDPSTARLKVSATSEQKLQAILKRLARLGATPLTLREVQLVRARQDGVFPTDFYSTTNLLTSVRYQERWRSVENIEMDCGIVIDPRTARASCVPVTHVRKGDLVVCGTTGVRVTPLERSRHKDVFQFMGSAVSSEKPKGLLIDGVAEAMRS
ncbi:MAG: TIGR00300 family protein, partial [Candidatus Methylomirabilales bacterium]